eukprot:7829929-Ditylum_brightwellii.AAC.1
MDITQCGWYETINRSRSKNMYVTYSSTSFGTISKGESKAVSRTECAGFGYLSTTCYDYASIVSTAARVENEKEEGNGGAATNGGYAQ